MNKFIVLLFCSIIFTGGYAQQAQPAAPDKIYGQLFTDVQLSNVFPDNKTFVDCTPKRSPAEIVADYMKIKANPPADFSLKDFVQANFDMPLQRSGPAGNTEKDITRHIKDLWPVLKRDADKDIEGSSLLPLANSYIVPGGRFREVYYWDSYFTMLGLKESGEVNTMENIIKNFSYLITTYGHIPNGNRTYYLSRSQPPFFSMMVQLLAGIKGGQVYNIYLPALEKEYDYWMDKTASTKHAVTMPDGSLLNRYYDRDDIPRQESYKQDVDVAQLSAGDIEKMANDTLSAAQKKLFRNLRSGAESGWDFSSRWLADGKTLATILTTDIIPVDLNCLLYNLELSIAQGRKLGGDNAGGDSFVKKAAKRKAAIIKYCWNNNRGFFYDYNLATKKQNTIVTAAGLFPLFTGIATQAQAAKVAVITKAQLLKAGGIVTTNNHTGQQWDAPNGWAPLQWVAVKGLMNYGKDELAKDIAKKWTAVNEKVYAATGKLMEKYDVEDITKTAGGGEYPGQDGFGWTNGVYLALKKTMLPPSKVILKKD